MSQGKARGLSLPTVLFVANMLALLLPVGSLFALRTYDNYLVQQTERQLIAQAVLIGERLRENLDPALMGEYKPPGKHEGKYVPIDPILPQGDAVPSSGTSLTECDIQNASLARAAGPITAWLKRSQTFLLSGVRIIDSKGCVAISSGKEIGLSMKPLPEVEKALAGNYHAIIRERSSPLTDGIGGLSFLFQDSPSRHGSKRVFVTLPIFVGDDVNAVVRVSRTTLSAWSSLWSNRRWLIWVVLIMLLAPMLATFALSFWIGFPLAILHRVVATNDSLNLKNAKICSFAPREIHILAEALAKLTTNLDERAEYVEEFVRNVSHELKTPIAAICGASDLLIDEGESMDIDTRLRFMNNIHDDAERMQRLLQDLLKLSRAENNVTDHSTFSSLAEVVAALCERYPDFEIEGKAWGDVMLSEDQLWSVLHNLADNAQLHGKAPYKIRLRNTHGVFSIDITNAGHISGDTERRAFERFYSTARNDRGSGIGLPLVKALMERCGGSITLRNEGDNVVASITFPVQDPAANS